MEEAEAAGGRVIRKPLLQDAFDWADKHQWAAAVVLAEYARRLEADNIRLGQENARMRLGLSPRVQPIEFIKAMFFLWCPEPPAAWQCFFGFHPEKLQGVCVHCKK